jgi:hypothetical protein
MKRRAYLAVRRLEPATRFERRPPAAAPFRAVQETELEQLKGRLLRERLARASALGSAIPLRRAANDAAALAWVTGYPLLLFPALFDEKARVALLQARRQERVRERSRGLLEV